MHPVPHDRSKTLVPLAAATERARFGHKAGSLAELLGQGFDVPDGYVLPAGTTVTREELGRALETLGGPVAIRSSGLAEDLADASFAGQYDTVLDVRGVDAALAAIETCVASAASERVAAYHGEAQPLAVLVQRMVPADAAGVAFSANPITGARDEVCISATRGTAEKLVAGEISGDEWCVKDGVATAKVETQRAIDSALALRIADLARRTEAARGSPQDIEWAAVDDKLLLLQARPITALPVAPAIDAPASGTWQKDANHFPEPVSPFAASTHLDLAMADMFSSWGLFPDGMEGRVIGHEVYIHVVPDDGGKAPPPWWLLGALARVIPSLRKKLERARRVIAAGWLDSVPADWERDGRAAQWAKLERYASTELAELDDGAMFAHVAELKAFAIESMKLHFHLCVPYCVAVHELVTTCRELLGYRTEDAARLLQGCSQVSRATTEDLAQIARAGRDRPAVRKVLAARTADVVERLAEVAPELADRLRAYLKLRGLRPLGADAGAPRLAERLDLVAATLADALEPTPDRLAEAREKAVEAARAKLPDPAARARFDEVLAYAERVYPLREDNVLVTDQLPIGLLRRAALELGRRLVERGQIARREDAVMLTVDELRDAMAERRDVSSLVARRKAEHAWVRANPGPMVYGPAPGKLPDLRGLPVAARRLNSALLFLIEEELSAPPPSSDGRVRGLGVSAGVHRGRVRVIRSPQQLGLLQPGEVLVCPTTTAAWMIVFERAGALVTDTGSVLSHTAIVAREFGLPAVVGTSNATAVLRDGDEVIVDGSRGTVQRCE